MEKIRLSDMEKKLMLEFTKMLNIHRRLKVAAMVDIAGNHTPDITIQQLNKVLDYLVDNNLVSYSRVCEMFYLGDPPEVDAKQQPLPADMIENLMTEVSRTRSELDALKRDKTSQK